MDVGITPPRRARGLTLIELMTTIAVAGISLAVAIPGWQSLSTRSAITTTTNGLLTDLRYARSTAVTRNRHVGLCPSDDGSRCSGGFDRWHAGYLVFVDLDGDRDRQPGEPLLRQRGSAPHGLRLQTTSGRPAIRFRPDGAAWSTNATFRICLGENTDHYRAIMLFGSGRARVDRRGPAGRTIRCS
jgi:type IV fimbrial biogenesis protein FimT